MWICKFGNGQFVKNIFTELSLSCGLRSILREKLHIYFYFHYIIPFQDRLYVLVAIMHANACAFITTFSQNHGHNCFTSLTASSSLTCNITFLQRTDLFGVIADMKGVTCRNLYVQFPPFKIHISFRRQPHPSFRNVFTNEQM